MEILVPLMPLFASLPFAVAAMWIAHRVMRSREASGAFRRELEALHEQLEALRLAHAELQERLDFAERVLGQVRDARAAPVLGGTERAADR